MEVDSFDLGPLCPITEVRGQMVYRCVGQINHRGEHGPWSPVRPAWLCAAVRHEGGSLYRCGMSWAHLGEHGRWRFIGSVRNDGSTWLGRAASDLWQQITSDDPDSWRSPDPASRAVRPQTPSSVPSGVEGKPLGNPSRGEGMATVAELAAALGVLKEGIERARGLAENAITEMEAQEQEAARILALSNREEAQAIHHRVRAAIVGLEDGVANGGVAIDQIDGFLAAL